MRRAASPAVPRAARAPAVLEPAPEAQGLASGPQEEGAGRRAPEIRSYFWRMRNHLTGGKCYLALGESEMLSHSRTVALVDVISRSGRVRCFLILGEGEVISRVRLGVRH